MTTGTTQPRHGDVERESAPLRIRPWVPMLGLVAMLGLQCQFDPAYRNRGPGADAGGCTVGVVRCVGEVVERCGDAEGTPRFAPEVDCTTLGQVCATGLGCRACQPSSGRCEGNVPWRCRVDGSGFEPLAACTGTGVACREGSCANLCTLAATNRSNVGCEYWAVQLDNARISATLNAAEQQYAVVVSNVQPDVQADIEVTQDDGEGAAPPDLRVVARATVPPNSLEVFLLGPRWVDGSVDGPGAGETHTARTRHAYRLQSSVPIIAYQFNPFTNAGVFSNDASLLKPIEALGEAGRYVVLGWPQTIAHSDRADQDFGMDLRAFLTVVGTRANTQVSVRTATAVVGGGSVAAMAPAERRTFVLQPFEVLNLETGGFGADFSGSIIEADQPIVVFSGSEASDAPAWQTLGTRSCCADHLEDQLDPTRTAGRHYAIGRSPSRTAALRAAGATGLGLADEPEFVRIVATAPSDTPAGHVRVRTTLPPPDDVFELDGPGPDGALPEVRTVTYHQDFGLVADGPVHVASVQASQEAAGVPRGYPGGDPSFTIVPPIEQYRSDYIFLTPDKYAFDFFVILAPREVGTTPTNLLFDGAPLPPDACERASVDLASSLDPVERQPGLSAEVLDVLRCQLSFPVVDLAQPPAKRIRPGRQNDGVHRLQADRPVGLVVYGFDAFVSYAYAGGTQLEVLQIR